jgi:hypothetical protein
MESQTTNKVNRFKSDGKRVGKSILNNLKPKRRITRYKKGILTPKDIYFDHVLQRRPEGSKGFIKYDDYKKVIKAYVEEASKEIIERGEHQLPFVLGKIRVCKRLNQGSFGVNWPHFRKTGELKGYDNDHSDNYVFKIVWDRQVYIHGNLIHKLKLARSLTSRLSKYNTKNPWVKDNYQDITPR